MILQLLQSIPFFSSLSHEDHLSMIENIKLHYFPAGHMIFKEGDVGDMMFIIRSGKLKVFQERNDYQRTLCVLSANDFFGEMALISDTPRNASVEVLEDTEVFIVYQKDLALLLKEKPEIADKISEVFIRRKKENNCID
jgi:CRP-like cAMP-binding protein